MDQDQKVRENRMRRAAERQGFVLEKSRRRDPRAIGYGPGLSTRTWQGRWLIASEGPSLNEVERIYACG